MLSRQPCVTQVLLLAAEPLTPRITLLPLSCGLFGVWFFFFNTVLRSLPV